MPRLDGRPARTAAAALALVALALVALAPAPSRAFAAPAHPDTLAARPDGGAPAALAAALGAPRLANRQESDDGRLLFREYIPAGETFDNWTRMLTVITVRAPDARAALAAAVGIPPDRAER